MTKLYRSNKVHERREYNIMSHKKAIILTCGIALLWSLAGWNIKMITWSPYAIAAGRSIISVVLLLPMVVKGKSAAPQPLNAASVT